jgi:hypothetical protein
MEDWMAEFDLTSKSDEKIRAMMQEIGGYSPEFQMAIRQEFQRRNLQPILEGADLTSRGTRAVEKQPVVVLLSTGEIPLPYDVLDAVFAYGSSNDGFLKTANPLEAYQKVAGVLKERALAVGGNGVTFATFDYRVAANSGCGGGKAFEVFAYGTAVRTRSV